MRGTTSFRDVLALAKDARLLGSRHADSGCYRVSEHAARDCDYRKGRRHGKAPISPSELPGDVRAHEVRVPGSSLSGRVTPMPRNRVGCHAFETRAPVPPIVSMHVPER